jgi:hypothetical protein
MNTMFFRYAGDPDTLGKQLGTALHTAVCAPFEPVDDLNVRLIMDYSTALDSCTYVIADGRCYFITSRQRLTGGRIALYCAIDVLETYSTEINALDCIIKRTSADPEQNENGWNSLLDDQLAVTECNTEEFEVGLDGLSSFAYDPRPYLAAIGYDAPNGSMRGTVDNFPVFT